VGAAGVEVAYLAVHRVALTITLGPCLNYVSP
jgi:hypothetical protein